MKRLLLVLFFLASCAQIPCDPVPQKPSKPVEIVNSYQLSTKGNKVFRDNKHYYLKGANIPDPQFMEHTGEFGYRSAESVSKELIALGANVIRLPIHPGKSSRVWSWLSSRNGGQRYIDKTLKPLTDMLEENKIHYILDFHWVKNWDNGHFLNVTRDAWKLLAKSYKNNPFAIFELTNEPIKPNDSKKFFNQISKPIYELIRNEIGANNLIIFGSPQWAHRPHETVDHVPAHYKNWALALHTYPDDDKNDLKRYEYASLKAPVIITEWGYGKYRKKGDNGNYSGGSSDYNKQKSWEEWANNMINIWAPKAEIAGDTFWNFSTSNWTPNTHILKDGKWKPFNMQEAVKRLSKPNN